MIRLHFVVEGQTEETFVNSLLVEHLGSYNIVADARRVETSRRRARFYRERVVDAKIYRGGMINYTKAKGDLLRWMKEDHNADAYFTTMFDLYALPNDFPSFTEARKQVDPYKRVEQLEVAFAVDMSHQRFIPYIQLHEFEALILSDPVQFDARFNEHSDKIKNLIKICSQVQSPEMIDDGIETAPSKRIINEIPDYAGAKSSAGPLIAMRIGLQTIRAKCPHFASWLTRLESLG